MGNCYKNTSRTSISLQNINSQIRYKQKFLIQYTNLMLYQKNSFRNDFQILQLKGKGSYGQVYRVISKQSKIQRAAKIIKKISQNQKLRQDIANQYFILKELHHPNIIKVYQIYQDKHYFYIISQICKGGELLQKIINQKYFSQSHAALYFYQILQVVHYLHTKNIMHRDIKPQNLLFADNSDIIKLIDFGCSTHFESVQKAEFKPVGTPYYIAPQVLSKNYNQKCDMWSCGVILYLLLSGNLPFYSRNSEKVLKSVQIGKINFTDRIWKKISAQAKDLIVKLIQKDVQKRLNGSQALRHPWFINRRKNNIQQQALKDCLNNMRNFRNMKKINEGILIFITIFLTKTSQRDYLINFFKQLDKNGDGKLSYQQFRLGYQEHYGLISKKQIQEIFDETDKDKSGYIDYTQFIIGSIDKDLLLCESRLQQAFEILDVDGDGKIMKYSLKKRLSETIPAQFFNKLIKQYDFNEDESINKREFIDMMKNTVNKQTKY